MPKIRVVQSEKKSGPFELVERELPQPGPGGVRVKVQACGRLAFPFIPYLGLVLCLLAVIGIVAAVWRVENWRRKMARGGYWSDGEHDTFSIIQPNQPAVVIMGYCSAVGIPLVLAAAWVILRFVPPTLA